MYSRLSTAAVFSVSLCSCSTTSVQKIALEHRYLSEQPPATCSQQRILAEKAFREKWIAHLIEPAKTTLVKSSKQTTKNDESYLAPVNSYRIAHNEWTFTNQVVSAFLNCDSRQGYVQARGGLIDKKDWYGPFTF